MGHTDRLPKGPAKFRKFKLFKPLANLGYHQARTVPLTQNAALDKICLPQPFGLIPGGSRDLLCLC